MNEILHLTPIWQIEFHDFGSQCLNDINAPALYFLTSQNYLQFPAKAYEGIVTWTQRSISKYSSFCSPCGHSILNFKQWFQLFLGGGKNIYYCKDQKVITNKDHWNLFLHMFNCPLKSWIIMISSPNVTIILLQDIRDKQDKAPLPLHFCLLLLPWWFYHFILNYNQCK